MKRIITAFVLLLGLIAPASADEAQAVRSLAERGDAKAQFALGTMYRDGQGVARDYVEALKWLHSAADQGLLDAQFAQLRLEIKCQIGGKFVFSSARHRTGCDFD